MNLILPRDSSKPSPCGISEVSLKLSPIRKSLDDVRREEREDAAAQAESDAMELEALRWAAWKQFWRPTILDRIQVWLNQPTACYRTFDLQDLCRMRYLQHRAKNP